MAVGCSVRQVTKVTETDYGEMEVTSLVGKETELDHQLDIIGVSWRGPGLCSSTDPKTLFQSGVGESAGMVGNLVSSWLPAFMLGVSWWMRGLLHCTLRSGNRS